MICSTDEVDPVDLFGHRVLHLQPGVHFEEVEIAVRIEEKFDRPHRVVAGCPDHVEGRLAETTPQIWTHHRRWALLHHLLVAALNRTLPFSDIDSVAVTVRHDLDFDVASLVDESFHIDPRVVEVRLTLGARPFAGAREFTPFGDRAHSLAATACHRFQKNRQPVFVDKGLEFGMILDGFHQPWDQRHPHATASFRDSVFEPMIRIAAGGGPTQVTPAASTRSAKSAFSARNP